MGWLVGREDETARLGAFLAGLAGGPSALVVEGEPGIGKTALLEATLAQAAGLHVLRARCAEAESGLAYAGLADLLGRVTGTVLTALPPPQRRALEVVLGRAEVGREAVEPHLVGRATLQVLRSLAAGTPLLVAIDDVQWLDPASARTLTFALRRLEAVPVGVLVTRREPGGPLPLGLDDALPQGRRERLLVGPLDPTDLELLVEERLGEPLPRALRPRLAAAAGGNPLYALELGVAQRQSGTVWGDLPPLPARLEELLADRLERLPSEATEPLAVVAGLAAPSVGLVVAVLGEHAKTALDAALDADVLRVEEGRLRFSHPLFGVAARARLAPSAGRALHARLAATLADPEERARHLVLAADGPDAAVAAAVEQGADRARARGAPEVAAELAEAAVRLTPPDRVEEIRRRRVAAGYHWVTAGEVGRGRAHLAAALEAAPPGRVRADLRWRLGMLALAERAAAVELLEAAERGGLVPLMLEGRAVLGFLALSQGDAQAAHAELGPLLERLGNVGVREPTWARLVWSELDALVELGELDQASALAEDLEARGRALDRPFALATAARARGLVQAARGDLDGALAQLERALVAHDRLGWPFERARTLLALGVVRRRGRQKRAARQALEQALALFDGLGARLWSARTTAELARIGGRPPSTGALTPTERRVAELVAEGRTNREVADLLFLSAKTVAAHLTSAYAKLGVRSRTGLAHRLRDTTVDDAAAR
jgi:DNA-binding CsgD family transcriptional regulator